MLKDKRGATLEVVVSRMRQISDKIRFIALSATIPNIRDVAMLVVRSEITDNASDSCSWLGRCTKDVHSPARTLSFGESFRPVKIETFVYGFQKSERLNDFAFDASLNKQ